MTDDITRYVAPKTIAQFMQSSAPIRLVIGPYGSGKSVGCVMEIVRRACEQEPNNEGVRRTKFVCVRNSYRQLDDTTLQTFLEWFPDGEAGRYYKSSRTFVMEFPLADGTRVHSMVLFRALDKPQDQKKVLSLEVTGAWFNEFREIPIELVLAMVGRCGRFPPPKDQKATWSGIIGDSNPPDKTSKYYKLMELNEVPLTEDELLKLGLQPGEKFFERYRQPSGRGPDAENIENLPVGYYDKMVAMAKMEGRDENWIRVHVDGEYGYIPEGKPVYEGAFSASAHVRHGLVPDLKQLVGVGYDPGLRHTAAVIGQMYAPSRWRIFREIVAENITVDELIRMVERELVMLGVQKKPVWFADPAARERSKNDKRSARDIIMAAGFQVRISEKGIETRINSVRGLLNRRDAFEVDASCQMLIEGFQGGYHLRQLHTSDGRVASEPNKNKYSHPHDALQYLVAPFEVPIGKGRERAWDNRKDPDVYGAPPVAGQFNPHQLFARRG